MFLTSEQVFVGQEAPYGLPFISFPSAEGDSTLFVTPGHDLERNRLIATASFVFRQYQYAILLPITFEEKAHEGWARFTAANPLIEGEKLTVLLETDPLKIDESFHPVTFMEF